VSTVRVKVALHGGNALRKQMRLLRDGGRMAIARGIYEVAHEIMGESKGIVPYEHGHLQETGDVGMPETVAGRIQVTMGYGGVAVDYAIRQHENMEYKHAPGKQAKYLENPTMRRKGEIPKRITSIMASQFRRMKKARGGK
jgi:hypothetical protein